MWWAWHGPIPARLVVMHRCDLPICCRRECLQLGTQADNLRMAAGRDRMARRGAGGRWTSLTAAAKPPSPAPFAPLPAPP